MLPLKNGTHECLKLIEYNKGAAAGTGVTAKHYAGAVQKTVITLAGTSIATTDNGANGAQGGVKVYDFPEGSVVILGVTHNIALAKVGAGISATATVLSSLGSALVTQNEATLTSTEADIVASNSTVLVAGAGTSKSRSTAVTFLDGTTTAKDIYLNLNVDAVGSTATDAITATGTITVLWANAGDY